MITAITIILHLLAYAFGYSAGVNRERGKRDAAGLGHVLALVLFVLGVVIGRFV